MKKPIYVNIDINSFTTPFLNKVSEEENISEESLYPYMEQYANTGVTDILIDIFCQYSATDSEFWTTYADKYLQKTENGIEVDYTERYRGLYKFNKIHGIDPHVVWFKKCKELGINPWITIRMNDCHCPDDEACFLRSDFFYEARNKNMMVGDKYGYFRYCFDYAYEEVRTKMLNYIEEQVNRYDVYGIELDFQREIVCFDYLNNKNCHEIMNDFMREARKIVKNAEKIHGHEIKLAVSLQRDIEQNLIYGFDAKTWDKENLVDILVITPRWETSDSDMPIAQWIKTIKNAEIVAGIETLVSQPNRVAHMSAAHVRAMMSKYLQQGSEGTYLFNYFILPWADNTRSLEVFRTCTDLETIMSLPMRHALTFQDIAPENCSRWKILPKTVENEAFKFEISTGKLPENKNTALILGFEEGCPDNCKVEVNGKEFQDFTEINSLTPPEINSVQPDEGFWNEKETHYYRTVTGKTDNTEIFTIKITATDHKIKIVAAEIDIY